MIGISGLACRFVIGTQRPRIRLECPSLSFSNALVGVFPMVNTMTRGRASWMWRNDKGQEQRQCLLARDGVRLPGGRQGRMLVM